MNINQSMLEVCEEALYLIRQDVTLPKIEDAQNDTSMEWVKCKKAFTFAVSEVLSSHDWYFIRKNHAAKDDISLWPDNIRKLLVYQLARELSVQIAGRTEDLKNLHAIYSGLLTDARIKDLSEEPVEDPLEAEVIATMVGAFSTEDKALPRSIEYILKKIRVIRSSVIKEVVSSHPWSFALDEDFTPSVRLTLPGLGGYVHSVQLPEDLLKVVTVYGADGEVLSWQITSGEVRAKSPIARILYIRDVEDIDEFSSDVLRLVVLRISADITKAIGALSGAELGEKLYRDSLATAKLKDTRQSKPSSEDIWGKNYYVEQMRKGPSMRRRRR